MLKNNYPTDWSRSSLKDLTLRFLNGGTPSTHMKEYWDGSIPWITGADAEQKITTTSRKSVTELGVKRSATSIIPRGNILLVTRTGVGKVSISGVDVAISQDLTGVIPKVDLVDVPYLYYQLFRIAQGLHGLAQGSIIQGIKREEVEAIEIPLPELPEQRAIADILSTVDEAIAQSESLVQKYQSIKQGLMSDLLTCGVDENGELRDLNKHPTHFEMSKLGLFPKKWEITTLGRIIARSKGLIQTGPFGTQMHAYDYVEEGVPTILPQNIDETGWINLEELPHITQHKARELIRHALKVNDVIFARRGELSKCSAINNREQGWICGSDFMLVRVPSNVINGKWFAHYYRNDICQRQVLAQAVGSTMKGINTQLLSSLIVALPNIEEQERIVAVITVQETLIREETANHNKLLSLKKGLMQDLLSGHVRVKV